MAFETDSLDAEGLVALRRDAHTIKGSALMLGVQDVGDVGHLFEDVVEHLIKHPELRSEKMGQFLFDLHDGLAVRLQAVDSAVIDVSVFRQKYDALLTETANIVTENAAGEPALHDAGDENTAETETIIDVDDGIPDALELAEEIPIKVVNVETSPSEGTGLDESGAADAIDFNHFVSSFFDEAKQRLASINEALTAFKSDVLDEQGLVALRRNAHTINGSALMLGVQDVGDIGHLFEEAVKHLITHPEFSGEAMVQFLFDMHDSLAERLQAVDSPVIDVSVFRQRYDALLAEMTSRVADASGGVDETHLLQKSLGADGNVTAGQESDEEENLFRPDVLTVKSKAGRSGSGRFVRVDEERLNLLSSQVVELSTGQIFSNRLVQDMLALQKQTAEMRWRVHELVTETSSSLAAGESLKLFAQQMDALARTAKRLSSDVDYNVQRQDIMLDDLRDHVLDLMLQPLESVFSAFPRAVRDIARRHNKKARLVIAGGGVECDQTVVESLMEPLVHLINNAIAHGIEDPEERLRLGKPEAGQISIVATLSGSEIHIEIIDDGQGIDPEYVKAVAVEHGVTTQFEADAMSNAEALELIFRSGFSTRQQVDETSGRGIGMNVVQDTVRRLTGVIQIRTEKGKGTHFLLSLPVSIAVQRALIFRIGSQRLGMLIHMVEQVIAPTPDALIDNAGRLSLEYSSQTVPLVDLRKMFTEGDNELADETIPLVVIARHIDGFTGIVVDELFDDAEIIVRELDPYLKRYQAQGLMGNTITDDGSVMLLMEPYGIKEMGRTAPHQVTHDMAPDAANLHPVRALLIDDSIIARQVEKSLIESMGVEVDTAIDGMDAIEKLEHHVYDVVISDLEMPRLDGFGLVRRMRNDPRFNSIPILIISTRESAEDRLKAVEAGANAYLIKQKLAQGELHTILRELLGPLTQDD